MLNRGELFIVSAPSGSGKTSVSNSTLTQMEGLCFSVSYTTRAPRAGETEGVDYHFVSKDNFKKMTKNGELLEWASVYGHYYGTGRNFVKHKLNLGWDVLLDIDIQGARSIRKTLPQSHLIFVLPPSLQALKVRLESRSLDDRKTILARLKNAHTEMLAFTEYDYLILNEDIEEAVSELKSIISAARCKRHRRTELAQNVLASFQKNT